MEVKTNTADKVRESASEVTDSIATKSTAFETTVLGLTKTPGKKLNKDIKRTGFSLSDLEDLVTKTVAHNDKIQKTDINAAVNRGSVVVKLNESYSDVKGVSLGLP